MINDTTTRWGPSSAWQEGRLRDWPDLYIVADRQMLHGRFKQGTDFSFTYCPLSRGGSSIVQLQESQRVSEEFAC